MDTFIDAIETWIKQHSALWGLVNFIAGLFGKLVFDILFGDRVKKAADQRRDKQRRTTGDANSAEVAKRLSGRLFSFGGLRTTIYVLDLNLNGYPPDALCSRPVAFDEKVPEKYAVLYREHRSKWVDKLATGQIFEGAKAVIPRRISTDRVGSKESKILRFEYSLTQGYVHGRTVADVFRNLDEASRAQIVLEPSETMDPFLSQGFGVYLAVISSDNQLAFTQRSSKLGVNPGRIMCGVAELTNELDVLNDRVDLFVTANRALSEELGINLQQDEFSSIKLTACIFDTQYHAWAMVGSVDLRGFPGKYSSDVLLEYTSTAKARDKWEFAELLFIPFTADSVAGYINSHSDLLIDAGKVTAVYALLALLPSRKEIAHAFKLYSDDAERKT